MKTLTRTGGAVLGAVFCLAWGLFAFYFSLGYENNEDFQGYCHEGHPLFAFGQAGIAALGIGLFVYGVIRRRPGALKAAAWCFPLWIVVLIAWPDGGTLPFTQCP